jgi:hypothetical protein
MAEKNSKITEVAFDTRNANAHTLQGDRLLEKSLNKFGFREAGTLDKNGVIISGNKRTEIAGREGFEDIQIFKGDPNKIAFIQYDDIDLDTAEGRELAIALNQTAKSSINIDMNIVNEFSEEFGIDLAKEWEFEYSPINANDDSNSVAQAINNNSNNEETIVFKYDSDTYTEINNAISQLMKSKGLDSKEELLKELLYI